MRRIIIVCALLGCGHSHGAVDGAIGGDDDGGGGDGGGTDGSIGDGAQSCPSGEWCIESVAIPATTLLASVSAVSAADVFAVGDGGTIIRRRNNAWSVMSSGTTQDLHSVWASSSSDVWAVGQAGTILHFDGTAWTAVTGVTTNDLAAVWASGANDVWAVGTDTVLHYTGTWTTSGTPGGVLLGISGTGPNDVWVAGEAAYVRHYTGSWSSPISPVAGVEDYFAIVAGTANVWVTTSDPDNETLSSTNGTTWTPHATSGTIFQGLWAGSATDVWGVAQTKVGNWNGSAWSIATPPGVTASLWGVSGAGADVFVVGAGAMILHRD